ncbi:dimethylamine monooxygenase subunit DmmA family protein [Geodermatophilus sp. SYSU D00079]
MGIEHTSVPRWEAAAPALPGHARSVTLLGLDEAAEQVVTSWEAAAVDAGIDAHVLRTRGCAEALPWLAARMADAVVGWRLLVAGPEADVLRARARALHLGAVPAEVLTFVTGVPVRRVHCAHCASETETTAPVDATCTCRGCGRTLHVYHHVSRRLGAYLGYMVDAEDAEPALAAGVPA